MDMGIVAIIIITLGFFVLVGWLGYVYTRCGNKNE